MGEVPSSGRSQFLRVRGLRLHVRVWGREDAPLVFVLHGWLDNSASFAPLVERVLRVAHGELRVVVPDQRGFGYSGWAPQGYWFPDYVADFDAVVEHFAHDAAFTVIGHSLGAQVASLYAGLRPSRVCRLALMDGLAVPDMPSALAPARYAGWLDQLRAPPVNHRYANFQILAQRVAASHPRLSAAQAGFLARCWGAPDARGGLRLLADPAHRMDGPTLYRSAEAEAIWHAVTAPTLLLLAGDSPLRARLGASELERRQGCFASRRTVVLEGVGHMMHVEAPRRCADALAAFVLEDASACV